MVGTSAFLKLGFVEYQGVVDRMSDDERLELVKEFDSIMQQVAMARGYVNERQGSDRGHSRAVKAGNSLMTKVRKLLNYSYPKSAAVNF